MDTSNTHIEAYCGGNNDYKFEPRAVNLDPGKSNTMKITVKERKPDDNVSLCLLEIPILTSNYKDFNGKLIQVTVQVKILG